ncbi:Oidioi.mRNA.OKI2018_I69.chr2.g6355.t1.cds [Oikopleura dioica]|uniref:Oidioi.mRNA.OKI2018_I69.chr2.g6355.t1.cds n=1 Tax=Oikopleura dioica TaxID=34765 RepID=A0ABN7T3N4_OIKDI|nr:Oidioi.mRNA.OKI2018_I69.chr2.g6355.t1.cds [Oikopleura dioica]
MMRNFLARPTLIYSRRTYFSKGPRNVLLQYLENYKKALKHGNEIIIITGYTVMVITGCCYTMYHNGVKKGDFQWDRRPYWKYTLNDRLSDFDWTDPTAKRFVKPGMYREAIFFGNTTGWKDDLKELLREIYQFDYYDANIPPKYLGDAPKVLPPEHFTLLQQHMIARNDMEPSQWLKDPLKEALFELEGVEYKDDPI